MKFSKNSILSKTFTIFISLYASIGYINAMELQLENIWVATSDRQKITVPQWQINQIKVLQTRLAQLEGPNSYNNPIDAPNTTDEELSLIQEALNVATRPEKFDIFYDNLKMSKQANLYNTAHKLKATKLISLINQEEKDISWESTITLPSTKILNQRLGEHNFGHYQDLGNKLGEITAPVSSIIEQLALILANKHHDDPAMLSLMLKNRPLIIQLILQDNPNIIEFLKREYIIPSKHSIYHPVQFF